ncbi:TPA: glutamate--tRNA ligase [Candidatus Woesearchaeota archaeon]|nr:glutamate--tRNA ligase [Candidatus Woesearchaeota archaeon]HII69227.1 glutamate--tRNA ligase [Candidatus Woesearchaeota archaeon]
MEDLREKARAYALQNAVKFSGKASPGAVTGKILAAFPGTKERMKEIAPIIQQEVKEVNALSCNEQQAAFDLIKGTLEEKPKEKKKSLPALEGAKKGAVVMRFEPSPSGPLHVGHAYVLSLIHLYCREYGGKLILRIADTNPENIYLPAYGMIPEDANWLTENSVAEVVVQSERMDTYYSYAEGIIAKGHAYVCTCSQEQFRELITKSEACPCRNLPANEHVKRWKRMFTEYKQGEAVVRVKTDTSHRNPAMRDWPALRINESAHPKQHKKYRVWPLMNFAVAIDDHDLGITHTVRAKDHIDNEKRQRYLFDYMGWTVPKHLYLGRINFTDMKVSSTETRQAIDAGRYSGWDDIRLPFLHALKRRGYQSKAFVKYAEDVGLTQNDKTVSSKEFFKVVNHFNKEEIEESADRYFFIENPVEVHIEGAPKQELELDLHPDLRKGGRKFATSGRFLLSSADIAFISVKVQDGGLVRLMDCLNLRKKGNAFTFDSVPYEKYKEEGKAIIHWLPKSEGLVTVEVMMPDTSIVTGKGEAGLKNVAVGAVIQLERFGFVRLDAKEGDKLTFWFAHK